jgi:antitoxin MazE
MVTRVQKWGNSQGLRFPRDILKEASISVGEEVDISVKKGVIIVKPAHHGRRKFPLKDLLSKMPPHYKPIEEDWGKPMGKEVW